MERWIGTGKTGLRKGPDRLERRTRAQIDEQHEVLILSLATTTVSG